MNKFLEILKVLTPYAWEITIVGVVVIIAGSVYYRKKIYANDIASFATTTGIFFTFFGIVLALGGLANLGNDANVQQKVDILINGIFVAFIPSIVGALFAALTHISPQFWGKAIIEGDEDETDIDAQILQELKRLNTNIVGEGESSLTTRLQKFQLNVTENQDALRREFQEFAENVAENIIEALKSSMDRLNEQLGEQFGENFRKFADVIPKLLEWQEQYRETIDDTQQQLKSQSNHLQVQSSHLGNLLQSIEKVKKSFTDIAEHAEKIAGSSSDIDGAIKTIATSLAQASDGMARIKTDAENFQAVVATLNAAIERQTELAKEQTDALVKSASSLNGIVENAAILDSTAQQLNKHLNAMVSMSGGMERLADTLPGKAETIEQNMQNITDRAITDLAGKLRGISEVLVEDYGTVQEAIEQIKRQTRSQG